VTPAGWSGRGRVLPPNVLGTKAWPAMTTRQRHTPEQVVRKLSQADRLLGEGKDVADVCRELQVSEQTYSRWRNQLLPSSYRAKSSATTVDRLTNARAAGSTRLAFRAVWSIFSNEIQAARSPAASLAVCGSRWREERSRPPPAVAPAQQRGQPAPRTQPDGSPESEAGLDRHGPWRAPCSVAGLQGPADLPLAASRVRVTDRSTRAAEISIVGFPRSVRPDLTVPGWRALGHGPAKLPRSRQSGEPPR
jgi:hypothetical protein